MGWSPCQCRLTRWPLIKADYAEVAGSIPLIHENWKNFTADATTNSMKVIGFKDAARNLVVSETVKTETW
jgi:hypothetical protein